MDSVETIHAHLLQQVEHGLLAEKQKQNASV